MAALPQELWQAYDELGEPLAGVSLTKQQARQGVLHGAAHVWIWRGQGAGIEILLQRRARDKHTWPGHLDISAAGHIDFGETALAAAIRETREESTLAVQAEDLRLLFVHRAKLQDAATGTIENEFQWVYGSRIVELGETRLQRREVESLQWMPLADFKQLASQEKIQKKTDLIVPHGNAYFAELLKEIVRVQA